MLMLPQHKWVPERRCIRSSTLSGDCSGQERKHYAVHPIARAVPYAHGKGTALPLWQCRPTKVKVVRARLPEVCGEWPTSLMGNCTLQETTCKAVSFLRI